MSLYCHYIYIYIYICNLITATTNINTDNNDLPKRHVAVLRVLSWNNNIIVTPDKGEGVVFMDSTHCNNKIIELFDDENTCEQISLETIPKNRKFH